MFSIPRNSISYSKIPFKYTRYIRPHVHQNISIKWFKRIIHNFTNCIKWQNIRCLCVSISTFKEGEKPNSTRRPTSEPVTSKLKTGLVFLTND